MRITNKSVVFVTYDRKLVELFTLNGIKAKISGTSDNGKRFYVYAKSGKVKELNRQYCQHINESIDK